MEEVFRSFDYANDMRTATAVSGNHAFQETMLFTKKYLLNDIHSYTEFQKRHVVLASSDIF
jgi:hypothetical protein